jgi:serine phosphatase RsbU (regulator of sigma subunit)
MSACTDALSSGRNDRYGNVAMVSDDRVSILLVDDEPRNLLALEAILSGLGQNLVRARSCREALKCLLDDDFAVIIMDVLMPEVDGFETAALIRERDRSSRTPIIFLTAAGASDIQIFRGYSVGAVDYLVKPVKPEILRSKIAVFVDLFKKTAEIKRQADQLRNLERRQHERELAEAQRQWEAERLQLELGMAEQIQQKLFPASAPTYPGLDIYGASFPAETMGGDYFDYIPILADSVGIVIGDVCGHGFGPALLMAATRAYLRGLALTYRDVGEILTLANRVLTSDLSQGHFVTLLLARLDPLKRSFVYASAGHPPAYILDSSGNVRELLESTALPLGVQPDVRFAAAPELMLHPGELVFLLTDGLVEAGATNDTQFGSERALDVIRANQSKSAREIVHALYTAVCGFSRLNNQTDDITAVLIKVESSS